MLVTLVRLVALVASVTVSVELVVVVLELVDKGTGVVLLETVLVREDVLRKVDVDKVVDVFVEL
jgi:hypothetical protein